MKSKRAFYFFNIARFLQDNLRGHTSFNPEIMMCACECVMCVHHIPVICNVYSLVCFLGEIQTG